MSTLLLFLAQYLIFLSPCFIFCAWITSRKHTSLTPWIGFFLTIFFTALFGFIGAHVYSHARPFIVTGIPPLFPHAADNGFPSDHTLLTAAIAAGLWKISKPLSVAAWAVALLVGIARVLAGVHWPIDIAGSIVFALLAGWISIITAPVLEKSLRLRS